MEITKLKENCVNITEIVFHRSKPFTINIQTWLTKDICQHRNIILKNIDH